MDIKRPNKSLYVAQFSSLTPEAATEGSQDPGGVRGARLRAHIFRPFAAPPPPLLLPLLLPGALQQRPGERIRPASLATASAARE